VLFFDQSRLSRVLGDVNTEINPVYSELAPNY